MSDNDRDWTHVVRDVCVEGSCFIDMKYNSVSDEHDYLYDPDTGNTTPVKNERYDPNAKREEVPHFCERKIGFNCLAHRCRFFAFSRTVAEDAPDGIDCVYFLDPKTEEELNM